MYAGQDGGDRADARAVRAAASIPTRGPDRLDPAHRRPSIAGRTRPARPAAARASCRPAARSRRAATSPSRRCAVDSQVLEPVGDRHQVACWRWREHRAAAAARRGRRAGTTPVRSRTRRCSTFDDVSIGYGRKRGFAGCCPGRSDVVEDLSFDIGARRDLRAGRRIRQRQVDRGAGGQRPARAGARDASASRARRSPALVGQRTAEQRRRIQYIFQNPDASLNPRARIGEILARPLEMFFKLGAASTPATASRQALDDVQPRPATRRAIPTSSPAASASASPSRARWSPSRELLLCDEILSALDVSVQANILSCCGG